MCRRGDTGLDGRNIEAIIKHDAGSIMVLSAMASKKPGSLCIIQENFTKKEYGDTQY